MHGKFKAIALPWGVLTCLTIGFHYTADQYGLLALRSQLDPEDLLSVRHDVLQCHLAIHLHQPAPRNSDAVVSSTVCALLQPSIRGPVDCVFPDRDPVLEQSAIRLQCSIRDGDPVIRVPDCNQGSTLRSSSGVGAVW